MNFNDSLRSLGHETQDLQAALESTQQAMAETAEDERQVQRDIAADMRATLEVAKQAQVDAERTQRLSNRVSVVSIIIAGVSLLVSAASLFVAIIAMSALAPVPVTP